MPIRGMESESRKATSLQWSTEQCFAYKSVSTLIFIYI